MCLYSVLLYFYTEYGSTRYPVKGQAALQISLNPIRRKDKYQFLSGAS
jgi:hypothetical protein